MHDFGKLTGRKRVFQIEQPDGTFIESPPVLAMYDTNDVEWHELFNSFERFDFYIALNDLDRVVSMEADPEHSQIAAMRIIGISTDEAAGFTNGAGGTAYGKLWDGQSIRDPGLAWAEFPTLSKRELWLAGLEVGIRKQDAINLLSTMPETTDEERLDKEYALIEFEDATNIERSHPLVQALLAGVGLTVQQADALWLRAAGI